MSVDVPSGGAGDASLPDRGRGRRRFTVGITADLLEPDPTTLGSGFADLAEAGLPWRPLTVLGGSLDDADADGLNAIILGAADVPAAFVEARASDLLVLARTGVGVDRVDVGACTRNGVAVTITPDAVRRPVAQAALALVLACAHRLIEKDRLVRAGRWAERRRFNGTGLKGRVLCVIGLGNIGREFIRLTAPLEMIQVAVDPFVDPADAAGLGVRLLPLDEALVLADVVVLFAPLTDATRHLLDARRLALLHHGAILVNVARGQIIDETALVEAIMERELMCGLDVFETEPLDPASPLCRLDRVVLAPHAVAWTDQLLTENARSACKSVLEVSRGMTPIHLFNESVAECRRFVTKLAAAKMENA